MINVMSVIHSPPMFWSCLMQCSFYAGYLQQRLQRLIGMAGFHCFMGSMHECYHYKPLGHKR